MSPDATAAAAPVARLRTELAEDHLALKRRAEAVRGLAERWSSLTSDPAQVVFAAYLVHAWYTGLETAVERVLRTIDRFVPEGARSHTDPLTQACTELPGVRPAILPLELKPVLLGLLGFRHFFRHAYSVDLDPSRVVAEVQRLVDVDVPVRAALERFDLFLETSLRALSTR
jgi:hypothetical protein